MWMAPSCGCSRTVAAGSAAADGTGAGAAADRGAPGAGQARPGTKSLAGKFIGRRKVKPKLLAVITGACTGCAGAPVCQVYCPVDECMLLVAAEDAFPSGRIWVDPLRCVGCKKCVSRGPEDALLEGCPWDAIRMIPTPTWEAEHGALPY